ncbi:helix-turn-helix domain-containing protein [Gordonia amarae]|uniref:Helix-turn-helix domain-containing protein n=2 Tax=Gordonia amarae TaxID=36821 RepID=A0A857MNM2_9ACTN|nr:helix-turn-helix transcriptional regulator [Gordonia amarae]MCS3880548.1 AraC-like DNA-binding protein [Gordonia amarae]QHN18874.1 helix-turn-helix domain-containing protein [Gordonia amarae]QHN23349.1 helix-turn-helix domain-containing protein [Gordonia amarae]QHN40997.1 helix-turn-helix domain-containing protein [Gordonia amarae]GAB07797.1 putative AraC family transcriptional regulator [Gordonia amarae NBRC 15530]
MTDTDDPRGVLYPARLPTFRRVPAPDDLAALVRWFWIPVWRLAPGRTSRQNLLPFPASNLVVQHDGIVLSGPTTSASYRDLRGHGWAVGILLRPAGIVAIHQAPKEIRDTEIPFEARGLYDDICAAMTDPEDAGAQDRAVAIYGEWLRATLPEPDETALLANSMEDIVAGDRTVLRVDDLAERLSVSVRTLQRLADRYVGLAPLAIIRRYRLQEGAARLRAEPGTAVGDVAADLGYADQAHFTSDFTRTLGMSPTAYRRGAGGPEVGASGGERSPDPS